MAASTPLIFGALLAGAVVIDYGLRATSSAFASAGNTTDPLGAGATTPGPGGYVAPIDPGKAHVGRTDQGVDISAAPGTPIRAIGNSRVVGILQNWFAGQPFVWFELLDGPDQGKFWYVAEQIRPSVRAGDLVRAGQPVGTVAPSGTALELGWATRSGATLAHATTGYTEGVATAAGNDFHKLLQGLGL